MNTILIGQAEKIDQVLPEVRRMIENEGVYVCGDTTAPAITVPVVSQDGVLYSVELDKPLAPERFRDTVTIAGPFRKLPTSEGFDAGDMADAAAKAFRAGAALSPAWISVAERLPTQDDLGESEDVLVRYRYTDVPGRPWDVTESFHDPDQTTNGGWSFGSCHYAEVSHWMPKAALLGLAAEKP